MAYLLASRLAARRLFVLQASNALPIFGLGTRFKTTAPPKPPPCVQHSLPRPGENHDDRCTRLGRPLSPHITIYKPQLSSFTSIWHRITGSIFSLYVLGFAAYALWAPYGYDYCQMIKWIECMELPIFVIWIFRYCFAFPIVYHIFFGTRHIIWDFTANFMTREWIKNSSLINLGLTTFFTLLVVFVC